MRTMSNTQIEHVEEQLISVIDRMAKTATTAAEVEALAAVVHALKDLHVSSRVYEIGRLP